MAKKRVVKTLLPLETSFAKNMARLFLQNLLLRELTLRRVMLILSRVNSAEVSSLRRHKDFVLVAVDAPLEVRYKRLLSRSRLGEGVSNVDDFRKYEERA